MGVNGGKSPRIDDKRGSPDRNECTTKRGNVSVGGLIATHQFEYLPSTSPDSTSNSLAETTIGLGTSLSFVLIG